MNTEIYDAAAHYLMASTGSRTVVEIDQRLREAVSAYTTEKELDLAIKNVVAVSGLASQTSDRTEGLMLLVALYGQRRALRL